MAKIDETPDFDKLFRESVATARDVLRQRAKGEPLEREAILTLRSVSAIISAWTRLEQTRSAREATQFLMARELAENQEQLRAYLKLTMPKIPEIPQANVEGEGKK